MSKMVCFLTRCLSNTLFHCGPMSKCSHAGHSTSNYVPRALSCVQCNSHVCQCSHEAPMLLTKLQFYSSRCFQVHINLHKVCSSSHVSKHIPTFIKYAPQPMCSLVKCQTCKECITWSQAPRTKCLHQVLITPLSVHPMG